MKDERGGTNKEGRVLSLHTSLIASRSSLPVSSHFNVSARCSALHHRVALILVVALTSSLLSGCIAARRTPNLERIFAEARGRAGKRPIIVIPGILGSELVNYETGEVVWPAAFRSAADGLSLPVSPALTSNRDNLVARKIVNTIKLARLIPEIYIYHDLLETLRKYGGYTEGDWSNPRSDGDHDTFYVFPYDWRRDNVETAKDFMQRVETLKRKLNRPDLRFNIVADSMGGLVARYAAMYGEADLPREGETPVPTWAGATHINKIIMFGTPNEGSANAFATMLEGYSITEGLRRRIPILNKLSREDVFTCPSIFQLMPHNHSVRFLDENLQPLAVDLYDPATWKRYNWSPVTDPDYRGRFVAGKTRGDNAPFERGSLENLDAYFSAALLRARHFQEALDVVIDTDAPVPLFAFGGDCEETLLAPILIHDDKENRWLTLTSPRAYRTSTGRSISRAEATRAMYAPGDGRVTRRSLLAEDLAGKNRRSPLFDTGLPIVYATFACDLHSDLQHNKTLQDNALTALVSEAIK
jgi:hypothetical protein